MRKIFFGVICSLLIIACNDKKEEPASGTATTASVTIEDKKTGDELLPLSEADGAKASYDAFAKGDIDAMTANYDDNIRYTWSGGDSLIGKKAVADYYKGRWNLIKTLSFSDHIVLPIKVKVQQSPAAPVGKWVLHWAMVHVEYKNGKKLNFWVHNVNHYNDAGKVDFVGQYMDRAPLMEATKDLMPK
jgi:hypothetical protein